ncbi:MAG: NAD(P)H-binding protein [Microbacterium sp.]|jgi:uncharacterized protein YbjT (DUF2867 family)|nr:NAD(P)H-binding protein [Microbacterium sp.]
MEKHSNRILIIGATGNVGRALVDRLSRAGHGAAIRALARRPDTADLPEGVEVVAGDLMDLDSLAAALEGVDRVFLMWPLGNGEQAAPILALLAARVRRVVYLSTIGVRDDDTDAPDPILQFHTYIEKAIRATPLEWTFVRSGGMASNTRGWAAEIRESSEVSWVYGDAGRALVHEADLAEIAEIALLTDRLVGAAPQITGASVTTQRQQAALIGDAIGRPVSWQEVRPEAIRERLIGYGWPRETAEGALRAWAGIVDSPEVPTGDFADITGHPARDFAHWAADHAEDFR